MTSPRFRPVRFGEGYDMHEVDDYIDRIEHALRTGDGSLTADQVLSKRFTPTRFAEGYAMDDVDDYLDGVAVPQLQAATGGRGPSGSTTGPGTSPTGGRGRESARPSPGAGDSGDRGGAGHPAEQRPGLLRRLFGGGR